MTIVLMLHILFIHFFIYSLFYFVFIITTCLTDKPKTSYANNNNRTIKFKVKKKIYIIKVFKSIFEQKYNF